MTQTHTLQVLSRYKTTRKHQLNGEKKIENEMRSENNNLSFLLKPCSVNSVFWFLRMYISSSFLQVAFFNNYLMDPKRPSLPEHPGNRPPPPREGGQFSAGSSMSGAPAQPPTSMMGGYGGRNPHMMYAGQCLCDFVIGLSPCHVECLSGSGAHCRNSFSVGFSGRWRVQLAAGTGVCHYAFI